MISALTLRQHITTIADALDLPLTMRQVGLLTDGIVALTSRGSSPDVTLTNQEHAVLVGLALGEDAPQTGLRLGRSVNTIKTQRRCLYSKLGARSGAQAVAIAIDLGLLRTALLAAGRSGGDA